MLILAPLAAMLIQLWVSRTREYEADATGATVRVDEVAPGTAQEVRQEDHRDLGAAVRRYAVTAERAATTASTSGVVLKRTGSVTGSPVSRAAAAMAAFASASDRS